jgi:sugar lactone lactonase YvrE
VNGALLAPGSASSKPGSVRQTLSGSSLPAVQPGSSDAFVDSIGANTDFEYQDVYNATAVPYLKASGIRHVRDGANNYPAVLTNWANSGVGVDAGWPGLYYNGPVSGWPVQPATFASMMTSYGVPLDAFEGTNESNASCGGAANWTTTTRAQTTNLWNYDQANGLSTLPLLSPSYGNCAGLPALYSDATSMGSLAAVSTYGNLHSYPGPHWPEQGCMTSPQCAGSSYSYLGVSNIENPGEPVYVTETGYESQTGGCQFSAGTVGQERYLLRTLLNNWNNGVKRTYLFSFIDDYAADNCYLGMITDGYVPKPSYNAVKNLIATLADPGPAYTPATVNYALGGSLANVNSTLLQKRSGTYELILWQGVASIDGNANPLTITPQTVTLQLDAAPSVISAQTFTDTGALVSVPVTVSGSTASVPVNDIPVIESFVPSVSASPTPTPSPAPSPTPTSVPSPSTKYLYAASNAGNSVAKFALSGGSSLLTITASISNPFGIAVDSSGNIYVANYGNGTVTKYNASGSRQALSITSGLSGPVGVAVDSSGNIYVANYNNSTITKYASSGGAPKLTLSAGVNRPSFGIAIDSSGNIYVPNSGNSTVTKYAPSGGNPTLTISSGVSAPNALALDSSGNIYVANASGNTVTEYAPSGGSPTLTISSGVNNPYGISVDTSGNIYVANNSGFNVTVYGPLGGSAASSISDMFPSGLAIH